MARTRTSGQGRPKGATNKATRGLKELLAGDAEAVKNELVRLCLHAESEATRAVAIKEYNDRYYGKALQQVEIGKAGDFDHMSEDDLADIILDTTREAGIRSPRRSRTTPPPESESLH